MKNILRPALVLFALLSVLTGLLYPLVVTGAAHAVFPQQAAGSLVQRNGQTVGSSLIGQNFSDPRHFWGRPSATAPMPYNAAASGGSNQGPLNPALADAGLCDEVGRRLMAAAERTGAVLVMMDNLYGFGDGAAMPMRGAACEAGAGLGLIERPAMTSNSNRASSTRRVNGPA